MSLESYSQRMSDPPSGRDEYDAVLEELYARINYERLPGDADAAAVFKLDRMTELLRRMGDPQWRLPAVHVAGTKGKGSTAAMIAAMLGAGGRRVGLFTSPHLERFEERMTVCGEEPSPQMVVRLIRDVAQAARPMQQRGPDDRPTFFEFTTAMAWRLFELLKADVVVLEVGLGGRLDATNVCRPLVTLITSISRDHTKLLGETLPAIAREKAGIIKPGVPVLSGVADPDARRVIADIAARCGAPLYEFGEAIRARNSGCDPGAGGDGLGRWMIDVESPWGRHDGIRVPLPGEHQVANTALAVAAVDALALGTSAERRAAVPSGLAALRWPLRIEAVGRRPLVIVDAAHNDASISALIETLRGLDVRRRIVIFATSRDKDAADMLGRLAAAFDSLILTQYTSNPRSLPVAELAACADQLGLEGCRIAADPREAWNVARAAAGPDDLICATGSFFLAAEVRALIAGR